MEINQIILLLNHAYTIESSHATGKKKKKPQHERIWTLLSKRLTRKKHMTKDMCGKHSISVKWTKSTYADS